MRAPPSDHAVAMTEIARVGHIQEYKTFLEQHPNFEDWFRSSGNRMFCQGREIQGISHFKNSIVPSWEDPKHVQGYTRTWASALPASQFADVYRWLCAAMYQVEVAFPEDVTGIKLIDKSNKTKTLHRLEVWYSRPPHCMDDALSKEISEALGNIDAVTVLHSVVLENKHVK